MSEPLFASAPTLLDPVSKMRVWCFDAARTVADQTSGDMTLEVAQFITGAMEAELQRRYVRAGQKVSFVHDWRSCVSYDARARDLLIAWGRASHPHVERVTVQLSPDASPFVRIAAATGIGVLRLAKMKIELVDDLSPLVRQLGG